MTEAHIFISMKKCNEEIPKEWLQGNICPLQKKGGQLE
jgi:hypothetical protein